MTENAWTRWPSREALSRAGSSRSRCMLGLGRCAALVLGLLLWGAFSDGQVRAAGGLLPAPERVSCWRHFSPGRSTAPHSQHRLLAVAGTHARPAAGSRSSPRRRASGSRPSSSGAGVPITGAGAAAARQPPSPVADSRPRVRTRRSTTTTWLTAQRSPTAGLALAGYTLRLDAEARGNSQRLLAQERAARAAEADSAALGGAGPDRPGDPRRAGAQPLGPARAPGGGSAADRAG